MAKSVKFNRIVTIIQRELHDKLVLKNDELTVGTGKTPRLAFNSKVNAAYCYLARGDENYRIIIGGELVKRASGSPDVFTSAEKALEQSKDIEITFYALDYHEMGHILFTDMKDTRIKDYPKPEYRAFIKILFNTLEDPIEEDILKWYCKKHRLADPSKYLDFLINSMFSSDCEDYEDDGSYNSFMNYLLLVVRMGYKSIKNKNEIFEKYKSEIIPCLKEIFTEDNGTERITKTIALAEWMIENITELDFSTHYEPPKKIDEPVDGTGGPGPVVPVSRSKHSKSSSSSRFDSDEEEDDYGGGGDDDGYDDSEDGDDSDDSDDEDEDVGSGSSEDESEDDSEDEDEDEDEDEGEFTEDDPIDPGVYEDDFEDAFNDFFDDPEYHIFLSVKDEYIYNDKAVEAVDQILEDFANQIDELSKFFATFRGRLKPHIQSGYTRGRLNMLKAVQDELQNGSDLKLFNQSIKRGKAPDVCFTVVGDLSGSMSGQKSELCCKGILVMGQACDWAGVPLECYSFTKTSDSREGIAISLIVKEFKDEFEKVKPYFSINSSSLINNLTQISLTDGAGRYDRIPTFAGNSEEQNLYYIWKRLQRVKHDIKVMLVFCDGCTTGSRADLARVVKAMEDDGIIVIGVGICDNGVNGSYSMTKIFNNCDELEEGLVPYLMEILDTYAR